jgi:MHS family proline/betaine transporter-like MFS transporter
MLHLVGLSAAISVGFYTTFVYSSTWLQQIRQVPASRALTINTIAMTLLLVVCPWVGALSDRIGRKRLLTVASALLALFAYPLLGVMARGDVRSILWGELGLAFLVSLNGSALPATLAELAPWRVRCTVLSVGYNVALGFIGGTTPVVATWLIARSGAPLAPAVYLTIAAAITFVSARLLPHAPVYRMTDEFRVTRFR